MLDPTPAPGARAPFPVVDLHAHPALKSCLLKTRFWKAHRPPAGYFPLAMCVDVDALLHGGVKTFVCATYVPERALFHGRVAARGSGRGSSSGKAHRHRADGPTHAGSPERRRGHDRRDQATARRRDRGGAHSRRRSNGSRGRARSACCTRLKAPIISAAALTGWITYTNAESA